MKEFIKSLSFGLVLITMLVFVYSPALATGADTNIRTSIEVATIYNADHYGKFVCKVNVPEGFNEIVCLVLMDNYGGPQNFLLLPENDYVLHDEVICGPYRISGYVNSDTMMEYKVTRSVDSVKITEEEESKIELTVTGGPKSVSDIPVSESDTETVEEGNSTDIVTDEGTDEPDFEPQPESSDVPEDEPEDIPDKDTTEENTGKSALERIMISVLGNVIFVGCIAGIAYVVRKYFEKHR